MLKLIERDLSVYEGWDKYEPVNESISTLPQRPYYLASIYTIHPFGKNQAFIDACKMSAHLYDNGYFIFSPVVHFHPISDYSDNIDNYNFWLTNCIKYVRLSKGLIICTMTNWKESKGIAKELEIATALKLPIKYANFLELPV